MSHVRLRAPLLRHPLCPAPDSSPPTLLMLPKCSCTASDNDIVKQRKLKRPTGKSWDQALTCLKQSAPELAYLPEWLQLAYLRAGQQNERWLRDNRQPGRSSSIPTYTHLTNSSTHLTNSSKLPLPTPVLDEVYVRLSNSSWDQDPNWGLPSYLGPSIGGSAAPGPAVCSGEESPF